MKSILLFTLIVLCSFGNLAKCEEKLEEKLEKKLKPFFVQIEFEILKNESPLFENDSYDEFEDFVKHKKLYRTHGIPINENTIILNHISIAPERFANIKVKTASGGVYEGTLEGLGLNRMVNIIKIEDKIPYPKLTGFDSKKTSGAIFESTIVFRELIAYLHSKEITSEITATPLLSSEENIIATESLESANRGISLLTTKNGQPLAIQTKNYYKFKNKSAPFVANTLKSMNTEELAEKEEQIADKIHKEIFLVKIEYRMKSDNLDYYNDSSLKDSENASESKIFGFLINKDGDLLLPFNIPIEKIKDIESIEVHTPDKTHVATFEGAYSTFGGLLIHCESLKGVYKNLDFALPEEENLFFSLSLIWSEADSYQIEITPNYLSNRLYSIGDRLAYNVKTSLNIKETVFVNQSLEICAINSKFINIDDLGSDGFDKYGYGVDRISYISLHELKEELKTPEKYFDNRAMQLNRQDALSPTWLGVIVQAPSNALLEFFKVLDKTKNGLIGLLVTHVYENSPAKTLGLKKLDILLSVAYENSLQEYEFVKANEYNANSYNQFDFNRNNTMELFPAIRNEITNVLSKLEVGKTVNLKYIRDGQLMTASFKLEKAPNDFNNASKYVDEDLGLHVKDVTFEVREALRLKETELGVIISEIEPGKAADIARLHYYCIILKVDDSPVTSVEMFKEIITTKKSKGVTEFYFTVLFLGKTSLIKVNLKN